MKYTLTKGAHSNYQIQLEYTEQDIQNARQKALQEFQKEVQIQWFRKGHVPLNLVEQQVRPEYLQMSIVEEVMNAGLKSLTTENNTISFMWEPYDLQLGDLSALSKWGKIDFKLDVYPQVEVNNDNRKKLTLKKIETQASDEEIAESFLNLRRQYAEYKEVEEIGPESIVRVKIEFKDEKGTVLDKSSTFVWPEEYAKESGLLDLLKGKKADDILTLPFDKKLPQSFLPRKDITPTEVVVAFDKIYITVLPEMNAENIAKFFWADAQVKTEDDIKAEIKKAIIDQKFRVELTKQMDEYLESAKKSLHVQIPNSIKEKEFVARMENMKKRFGGEEKWNGYVQQVGQAEIDKINEEVRQATHVSLEKYFLFQKIAELLDLKDIDWNKEFDAEMKMYNLLQK